jgi:hypothetical protein
MSCLSVSRSCATRRGRTPGPRPTLPSRRPASRARRPRPSASAPRPSRRRPAAVGRGQRSPSLAGKTRDGHASLDAPINQPRRSAELGLLGKTRAIGASHEAGSTDRPTGSAPSYGSDQAAETAQRAPRRSRSAADPRCPRTEPGVHRERQASVIDEDIERFDFLDGSLKLRHVGYVQGQGRDAPIRIGEGLARTGIHPLRASPQGFLDQPLPETGIGPGHQMRFVCDCLTPCCRINTDRPRTAEAGSADRRELP